jgi:hypothetical protein
MTAPVKLNGSLPEDRRNGLYDTGTVNDFLAHPRNAVLVVGVVYNWKTETFNEGGDVVPVLRFKHVEVIQPGHDHYSMAAEILHQAHQARTGEMMLPFQPGEDIPVHGETTGDEPND